MAPRLAGQLSRRPYNGRARVASMAATVEALRRAVPLPAHGPVARVARPDPRRRDVVHLGSGALLGRVQRRGRGGRRRRRRYVCDLFELLAHLLRDRVLVVGLAILDVAVRPFATAFRAEFDLPLVPRHELLHVYT